MKSKGFTLIELIIVLAIVAICVSMLISTIGSLKAKKTDEQNVSLDPSAVPAEVVDPNANIVP